ncbi:MAG: hypothetical protein AAFV98_11865 [Chloroflexota bacterium]
MTTFEPVNLPLLVLALFGFIVGLKQLNGRVLLILLLPLGVMLVFSYLRLYPLHSRFLLFTFPAIMLVVVAGWYDVYTNLESANTHIANVTIMVLCVLFIWNYDPLLNRIPVANVVEISEYVEQQTPTATLFVTQYGLIEQVFAYYDIPNYQSLDRMVTIDSLRSEQPVWILEERTHLLSIPIRTDLQSYQSHYDQNELLLYCVDGTEVNCPLPTFSTIDNR